MTPPTTDWTSSTPTGPVCANCGNQVSHDYHRVWSVDGVLESCYDCQSRTQRYSNNPVIDPEDEDREPITPTPTMPNG